MSKTKSFSAGAVIFREGQWEMCAYEIVSGKVGIYADYGKESETLLTELRAGKLFGEMGLIEVRPRSATAVALEDTETAVITEEEMREYFKNDSEKIVVMFKNLSARLRELSGQYLDTCDTIAECLAQEDASRDAKPGLWAKIRELLIMSEEYASVYNEIVGNRPYDVDDYFRWY